MRVKVTRTVDLEEIPALVEKIIVECKDSLKSNGHNIAVEMHDVPNMVHSLEHTMENLSLVAVKLQDVINIVTGWQEASKPTGHSKETLQGGTDEQL